MSTKVSGPKKALKPKTKKPKVEKTEKVEKVEKVEKKVEDKSEKPKSKTTTTNIDNIIRVLVEKFELDEKVVRATLKEHLPSTSEFKKKKARDPTKPKKNLSAYIFFTQEHRELIKKDHPDFKFSEITKELGRRWNSLSADDKKKFEDKSEVDRTRYQSELSAWKVKNGIVDKPKNDKENNPDYVKNPDSGKMVKKSGSKGRAILKKE